MVAKEKQKKNRNRIVTILKTVCIILLVCMLRIGFQYGNTSIIRKKQAEGLRAENALVNINEDSKMKNLEIVQRKTGVGPWDADDEPGNDSNDSNNIVRSFDTVSWTVRCTWGPNANMAAKEYKLGTIFVKAVIPESIKPYVEWDVKSMGWAEGAKVENGVFTAYYELPIENCYASGNKELHFDLKVLGAPNNLPINPTFYAGLKENAEEANIRLNENASANEVNSEVKVSATPRLNIKIAKNSGCNYKSYFDWKNGVESKDGAANANENIYYGRMQGYGIVIQLYNPDFIDNTGATRDGSEKGLKGIAVPDGNITFELSMKEQAMNASGEELKEGGTPIIWDYIENIHANTPINGKLNKNMYWGNLMESTFSSNAPANIRGKYGNVKDNSCYNAGDWDMPTYRTPGNSARIRISNYEIDGKTFPIRNVNTSGETINYKANVGCISAGYVQAIMQIPEDVGTMKQIYMTAEVTHMQFYTLEYNNGRLESKKTIYENNEENYDVNKGDNKSAATVAITSPGSYGKTQWFQKESSTTFSIGNNGRLEGTLDGEAAVSKGNGFFSCVETLEGNSNDEKWTSLSVLHKFDDRAFEPNVTKESDIICNQSKNYLKVLYAARPNKKGWSWKPPEISDAEWTEEKISQTMEDTREEDLLYFTNFEELKNNGYTCVGVLYEYRNTEGKTGRYIILTMKMKVKNAETAVIGKTYQMIDDARFWTAKDDTKVFTWENEKNYATINENANTVNYVGLEDRYPTPTATVYNKEGSSNYPRYVKTEYDENMVIKKGTHFGGRYSGNTILVVGANLSVKKEIYTKVDGSDAKKKNYDMGKHEYEVEYIIKPKFENKELDESIKIEGITIYVTETLPEGLTYAGLTNKNPSSVSEDKRTIVWKIENVNLNDEIPPITYKAKIFEESPNGKEYEAKTVVEIEKDKLDIVGNTSLIYRTGTDTIRIVNLSGNGFYKTTEQQIIEKDGTINYHLVLTNVTTSSLENYQLIDILPYNNDSRGSKFNGTYSVKGINITQTNKDNNTIPNDDLNIYVSSESSARDAVPTNNFTTGTIWKDYENGREYNGCTAFAITGKWKKDSRVEIDLAVKTQGNNPGDVYVNSYSTGIREGDDETTVFSNVVSTQVVSRKISGFAWIDANANGLYDEEKEKKLSGIEVAVLSAENNSVAKDVYGQNVSSTTTDAEGRYEFNNLVKGNYVVKFNYKGEEDYRLTKEKEGGDSKNEINSKAHGTGKEGTTEIIYMDTLNNAIMEENYINAGYLSPKPIYPYTIKHVEKGNETNVLKLEEDTAQEDSAVEVKQQQFEGYKYDSKSVDTITIKEKENTAFVYYEREKYPYTVKYVDNESKKEIKESKTVTGKKYGDTIKATDEKIDISGYYFVKAEKDTITLGTNESENVIILYYGKAGKVIVKHIDKENNKELKVITVEKKPGEKYTAKAENFENYELVEKPKEETVTVPEPDNNVTLQYYYSKVSSGVIEKHVDIYTNEVLYNNTHKGKKGDTYEISSKSFSGYELVEDQLPKNSKGKMTEEVIEVTYYYRYPTRLVAQYLDENGEPVAQADARNGYAGNTYKVNPKQVEGYELISSRLPENAEGTLNKKATTVTYYYRRVNASGSYQSQTSSGTSGYQTYQQSETRADSQTKSSSAADTTVANKTIPQTGGNKIIISALVGLLVITILIKKKTNQYKDI